MGSILVNYYRKTDTADSYVPKVSRPYSDARAARNRETYKLS